MADDKLAILYEYIDRGWNIIPILTNDKRPAIKWQQYEKESRVTKDHVETWFNHFPGCNWAVVCGELSNVVCLDIDGPEEGAENLWKYHPEIQSVQTLMAYSPKGCHMFFLHPGAGMTVKSFPIMPKVDVKGDGGYVLIAPSVINDTKYSWITEYPLSSCPGWITRGERPHIRTDSDDENEQPANGQQRPEWVTDLLQNGSPSGRRNDDAARLVGYFHSKQITRDIIEKIVAPWAELCNPPFSLRELKTVIRSVTSYRQTAANHGIVDPPDMVSSPSGFKFSWHQFRIEVLISKITDHERYGIIGELEIRTNGIPTLPKHLFGPIDISLKNAQSLATLINECEKRMFGPPWKQMIADMARLTLSQFSQGEPWSLLREAPRAQSLGFAHKPLLLAREPTLWFSAGGGMKSYLALALAITMETGMDIGLGAPLVRNHVAYLDWEWNINQHASRLDRIISPEDQERYNVNIVYRKCVGRTLRKQTDQLKRMIAEEGITYVIIDSAAPASGKASDNDDVVAFFQAVGELSVGSLILAHVNKNDRMQGAQGDDVTMAFGGVQWENQSRSTWNLRKIEGEDASYTDVILTHQKVNAGSKQPPYPVRFHFPPEHDREGLIRIEALQPSSFAAMSYGDTGISMRDRIMSLVGPHKLTIEELGEGLDHPVNQRLLNVIENMLPRELTKVMETDDHGQPATYYYATRRRA